MAKTRKQFATSLIFFSLFMSICQIDGNVRQRDNLQLQHARMKRDVASQTATHFVKTSLRHHVINRRDAEDRLCKEQEKILQDIRKKEADFLVTNKFQNETKFSIAIAWAGENTGKLLVVTTDEVLIFMQESTVYQSSDDGRTFSKISSRVRKAQIHRDNGLQKDPHNPAKIFLVAYSNLSSFSDLWITEDGGDTFKQVQLNFTLRGGITFYPDKMVDVLLIHTEIREVYVSQDGGFKWKAVKDNVEHIKWGTDATGKKAILYATCNKGHTLRDNRLLRSTDFGSTWVTIKESIFTFGSQGKFLYASVNMKDVPGHRLMEVSTDEGRTWNEVQLPSITEDRFYSILDMSEGMVFMHVDSPNDSGQGTLYTSDTSGIIFSESLKRHLYPNNVDLTDFYKVRSIRGVYLASQIDAPDGSIHTVITFDRGASWQAVRRPSGVMCKNESKPCFLQIHGQYSQFRGIPVQTPLSIENAVGLIVVHGHVADALQTTAPDVFVSSDGGYTWSKALDGPHTVQIADHGGLMIAIPSVMNPQVIKFSTDEGRCWHSFNFTSDPMVVTGLLTEPGNRAMSVGIWGFAQADRVWRVHVLNFSKIITKQCDKADYTNWVAHGDNTDEIKFRGCLLGLKETFRRLKKDGLCANGYAYEVNKTQEICLCRLDDYDCDYGYARTIDVTGQQVCMEDPKFANKKLDICRLGHEEEIVTKGYRKVPGDKCKGGFEPSGEKLVDLNVNCNMNSKELIIKEIELAVKYILFYFIEGKKELAHRTNSIIWVCVVMTVLLVGVIAVVYFVKKYNLLRKGSDSFAYSSLSQNEDGLEEALLNTSLHDETTDELPAATDHGSTLNNYLTITRGGGGPASGTLVDIPHSNTPTKYSVQPHLKNIHDDSDVDMLD